MHVMIDRCLVPLGVGVSVSRYVAECERVLAAAGLECQLHPYGTVVEGEWEQVFNAVRQCHEAVHAMGCPRVFTTLKVGTRTDKHQTADDKVASVRRCLEADDENGDAQAADPAGGDAAAGPRGGHG